MAYYTVKEGEQLLAIFLRERGRVDVEAVTGDAKNKSLFETRTDLVLRAGDALWLPDDPPKPRVEKVETGALHRFQVKGHLRPFSVVLKTPDGKPLADTEYELIVDGRSITGTTDGSGKLEANVPVAAQQADVRLGASWIRLRIGGLDPITTIKGIQGRLYNLGYAPGPIDGVAGPRTASAIAAFQGDHGLTPNGRLDDATRDEIKKTYGF
jgi:hypothetical protein